MCSTIKNQILVVLKLWRSSGPNFFQTQLLVIFSTKYVYVGSCFSSCLIFEILTCYTELNLIVFQFLLNRFVSQLSMDIHIEDILLTMIFTICIFGSLYSPLQYVYRLLYATCIPKCIHGTSQYDK